MKDALAHLQKEGSTVAIRDRMADVKEYFDAVNLDRYLELEKEIFPSAPPK